MNQNQAASSTKRAKRGEKLLALTRFHEQILALRAEGKDLRAIASHVNVRNCTPPVDHCCIHRYLKRHDAASTTKKAIVNEPSLEPIPEDRASVEWVSHQAAKPEEAVGNGCSLTDVVIGSLPTLIIHHGLRFEREKSQVDSDHREPSQIDESKEGHGG